MNEMQKYDSWVQECGRIRRAAYAEVFRSGETGLPFRIVGVDPPPARAVWVWESEEWDGGARIGWHRTHMYGGYGPDLAGCNWWNTPVFGRCDGNPYWVPGDVAEADLPDMGGEGPGMIKLAGMEDECAEKVKTRAPVCPVENRPGAYEYFVYSSDAFARSMGDALSRAAAEKAGE